MATSAEVRGGTSNGDSQPEKIAFPPAPVWYKANGVSARNDMWAYVAGQTIILVEPRSKRTEGSTSVEHQGSGSDGSASDGTTWPSFSTFGYQKEYYACLSFCQSSWEELLFPDSPLVTGCKQGFVRIWNVRTGKCLAFHDQHKDVPISCLDWSARDPRVIYSMDENGELVSWHLTRSILKRTSFGKINPVSLHVSPHEDNLIAIGTKGGLIMIVRADPKGTRASIELQKLRHEEELVTARWCPMLNSKYVNPTYHGDGAGAILASSIQTSRVASIRLWNTNGDDCGIYETSSRSARDKSRMQRHFTPLLWATDPNDDSIVLFTSGKHGEIVMYPQSPDISSESVAVHDVHYNTTIFGLVQCGDVIWSTSLEPILVGWNLRTKSVSCVVPTMRGVNGICSSPVLRSLMGIGGSDGHIRVLDLQHDYPKINATKRPYISNRLKAKIMALAWHPQKDNLLGFGTDDGVLGYFELKQDNRYTFQFTHRVKGIIYGVDWGPLVTSKDKELLNRNDGKDGMHNVPLYLYACGGNRVFMISPLKRDNPLLDVSAIIHYANPNNLSCIDLGLDPSDRYVVHSKVSDIRWSPDFSVLAVGYDNGKVELYTPPYLQLKSLIKCHSCSIQHLNWRAFDFIESYNNPEHKERWLATASNDSTARIMNLEHVFEKQFLQDDGQKPMLIISSSAILRNQNGTRIINTAWGHHDPNLIVTVSYDCTAVVWNIRNTTPIARYLGHAHRLVACIFHPTSPHRIITASDEYMHDLTLHVWDYREHPYLENASTSKKSLRTETEPIHIKGKNYEEEDEEEGDIEVIEAIDGEINIGEDIAVQCGLNMTPLGWKLGSLERDEYESLLPCTESMISIQNISLEEEIRYIINASDGGSGDSATRSANRLNSAVTSFSDADESMIHLALLGSCEECRNLIKMECESHAERGEWDSACLLASWVGHTEFVEKVIEEGHVTETTVNMAKCLSRDVYAKACMAYAEKLISEKKTCKGASYLFMAGLKERAIMVLAEHELYIDAKAMMSVSIEKRNKIYMDVMKFWLKQLLQEKSYELVGKVYLSLGMSTMLDIRNSLLQDGAVLPDDVARLDLLNIEANATKI